VGRVFGNHSVQKTSPRLRKLKPAVAPGAPLGTIAQGGFHALHDEQALAGYISGVVEIHPQGGKTIHAQNALQWSCRSRVFQRTADSVYSIVSA
jgi:hypothetical protein